MAFFNFLFFLILSFQNFVYFYAFSCDTCIFTCCDIYGNCATNPSFCYCKTTTCSNKCCVNEHCGTEDECSNTSTLAVIIVLITIFAICLFCFTVCLCMSRIKEKNIVRNRIRNNNNHENDGIEVIQLEGPNSSNTKKIEGLPIENVFLGQPVDFTDSVNERIMQGKPVDNTNL